MRPRRVATLLVSFVLVGLAAGEEPAIPVPESILVVQGANDPRVPLSESERLVAKVRNNGVPVWYVVGLNEGHGFAKKPNQDYQQAVEVQFLKSFLLNAEVAPP